MSEKYILEHLSGYLLDLDASSNLELTNLSKDADFYLLESLKKTIVKHVKARARLAKSIPPAPTQSIEVISELPEDDQYDHSSHTLCIKNVGLL